MKAVNPWNLVDRLVLGCLLALLAFSSRQAEARNVTVSLSVPGAYRSIGEAILAIGKDGGTVRLAPGVWREKLTVAANGITLIGLGAKPADTVIEWSDSSKTAGGTFKSATLTVTGDEFTMANLTVRNGWGLKLENPPSQAVALAVTGDKAYFEQVDLIGRQDTLYANKGLNGRMARQYFSECFVEGHVDFIFGNAKAFFNRCRIHAAAWPMVMLTAQSRNASNEDSAFVFDRCRVTAESGTGEIWLGRPWRDYSRVIFLDTRMDTKIVPAGWREWTPGTTNRLPLAFYAEYRSQGIGASPHQRVATSHQLDARQAREWRADRFFAGDTGWINAARKAVRSELSHIRR
ncbi:pectinesterase family protein [Novosphingobium sp. MW5]|nr:pectinesterase family protein [Novosphingobium sp. MW5]